MFAPAPTRRRPGHALAWLGLALLLTPACSEQDAPPLDDGATVTYTETRESCADRNPRRNLYWGDLHFHTRHSWDAYGYHLTVTPKESYAFARGQAVSLPDSTNGNKASRKVTIDRPLDFAAVTDHAEFYGELRICRTPGLEGYDSASCKAFRKLGTDAVTAWGMQMVYPDGNKRQADICGADGKRCRDAARAVWSDIQQAAEQAYDRTSACSFVSLVGYEYTSSPTVTNLHRNVIFRNERTLDLPITYYESPTPWGLWDGLIKGCLDAGAGCDAMVIPHNMNWSNGTMFVPDYTRSQYGSKEQIARMRARIEPVMEIFQHKGDQECQNGLAGIERQADPLCEFEKLRFPPLDDCGDGTGWGAVKDMGCTSQLDFTRGILLQGLLEQQSVGANPYRVGVIGSTDSHNGTPGNTREKGWPGHVGTSDDTPDKRLGEGNMTHRGRVNNPGGLAAVWAVERSRDAIFQALRRRETYATSGTRIALRLFGGWDFPDALCSSAGSLVAEGYARGVPMGGVLPPAGGATAPVFALQALADPGTAAEPGTPLQVAQIIKGWVDGQGKRHEKVYTVAGSSTSSASVDAKTCKTSGTGHKSLCAVWRDPDFDPTLRAFYYARVVENPICRWSTWECNALAPASRPKGCSDPNIQKVIQERAWSSAIWYEPQK